MQAEQIIEYLSTQAVDPIEAVRPMIEATAAIVCAAAIEAPEIDMAETIVTSAGPVLHQIIMQMLSTKAAAKTKRPAGAMVH